MTSQPKIVILEDERAQLLAVRAALHGIGELKGFADPSPALVFLKHHMVDAAIVDIHMPHFRSNGMDFIRAVREFDKDLCVIIRTGDASADLADGAIEVRAFRRAIKGKTSINELRDITLAAVEETRIRRQVSSDAANTTAVKTQWVQTLGSAEETLSVKDSYKGLVQGMRNQLTAIAGFAEVMEEATQRGRTDLLKEYAAKNKLLVGGLLTELNVFLDGPFSEALRTARTEGRGTVNGVLESLRKHFLASPQWEADQKSVTLSGLGEDMCISASPVRLMTAIRHLLEFCFYRSPAKSVIRLTTHCVDRATSMIDSICDPKLVFTEGLMNRAGVFVTFRVCSRLVATSLEDIRRSFHEYPKDPHSGNLQMIPLALGDELAAITVHLAPVEATVFDLYLPVSR